MVIPLLIAFALPATAAVIGSSRRLVLCRCRQPAPAHQAQPADRHSHSAHAGRSRVVGAHSPNVWVPRRRFWDCRRPCECVSVARWHSGRRQRRRCGMRDRAPAVVLDLLHASAHDGRGASRATARCSRVDSANCTRADLCRGRIREDPGFNASDVGATVRTHRIRTMAPLCHGAGGNRRRHADAGAGSNVGIGGPARFHNGRSTARTRFRHRHRISDHRRARAPRRIAAVTISQRR